MSLVVDEGYSLHRIFNRRDKLFQQLGSRFANQRITDDVLSDLASGVHSFLPAAIPLPAVFQSLFELAGEIPTKDELFNTFWRIAGNLPILMEGKPVHPWNSQRAIEVVPAQVLEVKLVRHFGALAHSVMFQFLAGSACSTRSHQYWSRKKLVFLAKRRDENGHGFMFSRGAGSRSKRVIPYPYTDARQLSGMRCLAVLDPAISDTGPDFQEIRFTHSLAEYNRELLKKRLRVDEGYVCPEGFDRTQSCHTCYIGRDKCSAGCHPATYAVDFCSRCQQQSYFDAKDLSGNCVNCIAEERKKKKES